MKKNTILITGCSHGGIGYDTCKYLKRLGHHVIATARKEDDVKSLRREGFESYQLDVLNSSHIANVFSQLSDRNIDVVFNNAGYVQPGALEDLPTNALREQFETNFFALHEITCIAIEKMRKQGYGKIIQHGSVVGLISLKYRGAYNASKYAIEGLCDTMRQELDGSNIFMSVLNTGPVTSNIRANSLKYINNIKLKKSVHLEEYKKIKEGRHKRVPFNEEAIAVSKVVSRIINSKRPKPRYAITKFTYIAIIMKRLFSTKSLDKIFKVM
jgi:short-subunit dehydrogenase